MQGPDALDRVQYMPPDKVTHLHRADPDKRQKFARTLEEEEDEAGKRQKKNPQDAVELKAEDETTDDGTEPKEEEAQSPVDATTESDQDTLPDKHIDVRA